MTMHAGLRCRLTIAASLFAFSASLSFGAAEPSPGAGGDLHDRIVAEYLDGDWVALDSDLAKIPASANSPASADLAYIRKTLLECRPVWWNRCKTGKKATFRASAWGQSIPITFDPTGKTNLQISSVDGVVSLTVMWNPAEMDDPSEAEHGFSKGDLNDLLIWEMIGTGQGATNVSFNSQRSPTPADNLLTGRYLNFRGNVTGLYYATPRARRWGFWLDLAAWEAEYAKMETVNGRKAPGAMFMEEIVAHRDKYPFLKLPESLPTADAESKLAEQLRHQLGKQTITLAEDQSLREAIKAFAAANALNVRQSGSVKLPSGLLVSMDPAADSANAEKRNEWLVEQLQKSGK